MIDRTLAPSNNKLSKPQLLFPQKLKAANGCSLYAFNSPGSGVVQVELVFSGGQLFQQKQLQATLSGQLMSEGTPSYTAQEIAENIDFYGASFQVDTDIYNQTMVLSGTTQSIKHLLPVLKEIATAPRYHEKEFGIQVNTARERFKVNSKKVDFLARQQFNSALYGSTHVLGKPTVLEDYDKLNADDVKRFFNDHISGKLEHVILTGDLDKGISEEVLSFVGMLGYTPGSKGPVEFSMVKNTKQFIPVEGAMQSAIRIGFNAIPRQHDDYPALQVANMLLGGYFGSRLMSNIREDKGYTYGIGSSVVPLAQSGYLVIATEVGADVTDAALAEIHKEIKRLCTEPVEQDELELARNYLVGSFIRNSDGVFAMADRFKALLFSGLDYAYYDHYFNVIENISAQEIMQVAKQYMDKPYIEIVAGGK